MQNYFKYAKELLNLAMPIIMGQIGFVMIMAGDVFVAARYSTDVLAAVSLAGSVTSIVFMFGVGLLVSVSPILSNKLGAKKSAKKYFWPTIKFSMVSALITTVLVFACIPIMCNIGFEEKLIPYIKTFTAIFAFSTFGAYLYSGLREFLQAYEIVVFPNFVAIVGIFLNFALCWILAFGWGPIPSLGVAGLAIASVVTRLLMGLALFIFCMQYFKIRFIKSDYSKYYKSVIHVGLPISCAICIEFLAFNSMAILMGRVSGNFAAAQNIINVIASTSFMIPLSISNAIAVKVGYANGARNYDDVKKYSIAGCVLSVGFMACCAVFFALFPEQIARIFTGDMTLIKIIVPVMVVVACFQVSDGLQVSLGGIFKGLKKTTMVMVSNFIGYLMIGVPLGAFFAFRQKLDLLGFWIGIGTASALLCVVLMVVLVRTYKKIKNINKVANA